MPSRKQHVIKLENLKFACVIVPTEFYNLYHNLTRIRQTITSLSVPMSGFYIHQVFSYPKSTIFFDKIDKYTLSNCYTTLITIAIIMDLIIEQQ